MAPTYLVTGGTGFLGTELVRQLVESGARVRILARNVPSGGAPDGVEFVRGTVLEKADIVRASEGVDGIFHLAGTVYHTLIPSFVTEMQDINVRGTLNVIEAAAAGKIRIVYASTSGVVGCSVESDFVAKDDSPYCYDAVKGMPYYESKIAAEVVGFKMAETLGVPLVALRPTLILGPGDERLSSVRIVRDFAKGKIPFVPTGGMSLVDVRDTATAFVLAMQKGEAGKSYLLCSHNCTVSQFFDDLERITGVKKPFLTVPAVVTRYGAWALDLVNRTIGAYDAGVDPVLAEMGLRHWSCDCSPQSAARAKLGWKTRPWEETVRDTLDWLNANEAAIEKYEKESAKKAGSSSKVVAGALAAASAAAAVVYGYVYRR